MSKVFHHAKRRFLSPTDRVRGRSVTKSLLSDQDSAHQRIRQTVLVKLPARMFYRTPPLLSDVLTWFSYQRLNIVTIIRHWVFSSNEPINSWSGLGMVTLQPCSSSCMKPQNFRINGDGSSSREHSGKVNKLRGSWEPGTPLLKRSGSLGVIWYAVEAKTFGLPTVKVPLLCSSHVSWSWTATVPARAR